MEKEKKIIMVLCCAGCKAHTHNEEKIIDGVRKIVKVGVTLKKLGKIYYCDTCLKKALGR